jgi:hypothetical protein
MSLLATLSVKKDKLVVYDLENTVVVPSLMFAGLGCAELDSPELLPSRWPCAHRDRPTVLDDRSLAIVGRE